jgi:hypothetical protein
MKLATTCNKNEQRQDAKDYAELQTEWTKATWKTFEEALKRDRNRCVKAYLVTDDDDDEKTENRPRHYHC